MAKTLQEEIAVIPGEQGWYHESSLESFIEIGLVLRDEGLSDTFILQTLRRAHNAVATEYGE